MTTPDPAAIEAGARILHADYASEYTTTDPECVSSWRVTQA